MASPPLASHFQFLFLCSPSSITGRSMSTALSLFFFCFLPASNSPPSSPSFLQIFSRPPSLLLPATHQTPLSFLHRKHFQGWHTRGDGCTENSATTIMSTLSSYNNTRINLPEEEGRGSLPRNLPALDGVSTLHRLVLVEV